MDLQSNLPEPGSRNHSSENNQGSMPWGDANMRIAAYKELMLRGLAPKDSDVMKALAKTTSTLSDQS